METICQRLASELSVGDAQVMAAIQLLDQGATVPFIARRSCATCATRGS